MNTKESPMKLLLLMITAVILFSGCLTEEGTGEIDPHTIPEEFLNLANPIPATQTSIERGRDLYLPNCGDCHGAEGRGDGHQAMMHDPRPSNLHDAHVQENTDGALFYIISNGVRGTAMAPFRGLSEADRWNLVNYMRTFEVEEGGGHDEVGDEGHIDENRPIDEEPHDDGDVH